MRFKSAKGTDQRFYLGPAQWLQESAAGYAATASQAAAGAVPGLTASAPAYSRRTANGAWTVERLNWEAASYRYDAWRSLAEKSIETNVFNEPEFALSAAQHFPDAARPEFLFISSTGITSEPARLVAVFAFEQQRRFGRTIGRLWCPPQMALATPLIHAGYGPVVLDLVQDWLANEYSAMAALMLPMIPANGRFAELVRSYTDSRLLQTCQFDLRSRAVLYNAPDTAQRVVRWMGNKRHKEMRRLWRRLSERGALEFMTARETPEVKSATEHFLALEALGWKGKRGTALLCDPSLATFTRTMSRRLARQSHIEIDALTLDRTPVAMAVVLRTADEAYFWKTTFREDYAAYSPGVLLALGMTTRLIANPATRFINSCAVPNHPMIDHLWPDRIEMMDLLVGIQNRAERRFLVAAAMEGGRRNIRKLAKDVYYKLRRKSQS
ncbi:MAG: GNAT family N-acetyltransferase [Hyphomicrobiales bacterium]|nr:GNAT family N-acetyltransferase [Hyphomicrobiales bacterium]